MDEKNTLGTFLRAAREQKQFSLRAVEKATGISNAYLSQIESGKIKQPSPTMLHKLGELYETSYSLILEMAGYPVPNEETDVENRSALTPNIGPVTEEEERALIEYLAFLRSRHSRKDE
jgi:transcriptional regulator with XRE-family HTH domain